MWAKAHDCQCEVFFLKCQQNVFWHRGQVVESWGFARGHGRGESLKWDVRAVGSRGRGWENSVTGKGHAGVFQQGGLVRRRKNHLDLSFPPSLLHYPLLLARIFLLTVLSWTSWEQTSQGLLMGQGIEGLKLLLLLGEDQAANPGNRFWVHAATEVLGAGQWCQVEGEGKALV